MASVIININNCGQICFMLTLLGSCYVKVMQPDTL